MLNPAYTVSQTLILLRKKLVQKKAVQLHLFFDSSSFMKLSRAVDSVPLERSFDPLTHSYLVGEFSSLFVQEIRAFVSTLLEKNVVLVSSRVFSFGSGDYTVLQDKIPLSQGVLVLVELPSDWDKQFGGYTVFLKDQEEVFRVRPIYNSVSVILTDASMQSFVHYVRHSAGKKKRIFLELFFR